MWLWMRKLGRTVWPQQGSLGIADTPLCLRGMMAVGGQVQQQDAPIDKRRGQTPYGASSPWR